MFKKFNVAFGERTDFSGFTSEEWVPHSLEQPISNAKQTLQ